MQEVAAAQAPCLLLCCARESCAKQVRLNTMRSLGTFIGPFGSTLLCLLPKAGWQLPVRA